MNKNKVLAFMPILYGKEYLRESLFSIKDHIDKVHIAYTSKPSHGFVSDLECPDTEGELKKIAREVVGDKLIWEHYDGFYCEAAHREVRYKYADDYSIILSIDADEVFKEEDIDKAIKFAYNNKERYFGINGYINFWRSFSWCCKDDFRPIRLENIKNNNPDQNLNCEMGVYHFSLCQNIETIKFKFKTFGHANEIRENYIENTYLAWTPEKNDIITLLHPATTGIWYKAEPFDKTTLPEYLKVHPNYNKELV